MRHRAPSSCTSRAPGPVRALLALAAVALLLGPAVLGAQGGLGAPDECYGFAFGRWDPPLDLRAAGHQVMSPDKVAHAPGGRDWAAAVAAGRDTTLLLFPAWWPAGVVIRFPGHVRAPTDTVHGRATALVADGRVRNPEAAVLAWPVPCSGTPPDRDSGRVLPPRASSARTPPAPPASPRADSLRGRDRSRPPAQPRPAPVPAGAGRGGRGR